LIYQDTKRFLKRHLKRASKSYEWQGRDNFLLLEFLQNRYSDKELGQNASEIKEAFREFYENIGTISFSFDVKVGVHYKIEPYRVSPRSSQHLMPLIKLIRDNRRAIEYPYQGREDQIALLGKIRRYINAEIADTAESVNKKELVRYAIKEALELDQRDVVIHLKRKYIVKIFHKNKFLSDQVTDVKLIDTNERRYMGYSADDLANHYDEFFTDVVLEDFLGSVMTQLFATKLNFEEITNRYYEKNVLSLIRDTIAVELMVYISENDEYLKGFAGYIFRKNFMSVHEFMAIELFEKISKKDKNAERFLNYYTGKIFIENGKRYEMPKLTTPNGERWNITSITAISTMWLRSREQLDKQKVKLNNLLEEFYDYEEYYKRLEKELFSHIVALNTLTKEFKALEKNISEVSMKFKHEVSGSMDEKKENDLEKMLRKDRHKLIDTKKKLLKLQPIKDNAAYNFKAVDAQYNLMLNEKQKLESEIRNLSQNLKINSGSFHSILASLVTALTQRRKVIG